MIFIMEEYNMFLRWWLITALTASVAVAFWAVGWLKSIYVADVTYLTFLISWIYIIFTVRCGIACRRFDKRKKLFTIPRLIESGWFASDQLLSIGMVGTVIGFIMMLSSFSTLDFEDVSTAQDLMMNLGSGMGTALSTTLLGLVGSVLLKVQYYLIDQNFETLKKNHEKELQL